MRQIEQSEIQQLPASHKNLLSQTQSLKIIQEIHQLVKEQSLFPYFPFSSFATSQDIENFHCFLSVSIFSITETPLYLQGNPNKKSAISKKNLIWNFFHNHILFINN